MKDVSWLRCALACLALTAAVGIGCGDDDDSSTGAGTPTATPGDNTPVPTATPGGSDTPVPTATPGGGGEVSAQVQAFVGTVLGNIADLGTGGSGDGGGAGLVPFPITAPCPGGGTTTIDCVTSGGTTTLTTQFDMCSTNIPNLLSSFVDGAAIVESSGTCLNPYPVGTTVVVDFAGDVDIEDLATGQGFAGTIDSVSEITTLASGATEFDSVGSVTSDCIGGTATYETTETIVTPAGAVCPTQGGIAFDIEGEAHETEYMTDGLTIDGESFDSCEDLAQCS